MVCKSHSMTSDPYSTMLKLAMSKARKTLSIAIIALGLAMIVLKIAIFKMDEE